MQMPRDLEKGQLSGGCSSLLADCSTYTWLFTFASLDEQMNGLLGQFQFGLLGLTLAFSIIQMMMVARYITTKTPES